MRGTEGTSETGSETADKAPTPAEPCTITGNSLSPGDDGWMEGRMAPVCLRCGPTPLQLLSPVILLVFVAVIRDDLGITLLIYELI